MKKALQSFIKVTLILMSLLPLYNASAQTTCTAPVANAATNITTNSATASWTISGTTTNTNILLRYRTVTAAGSPWVNITTGGFSHNLINLAPATQYEYQVARYCINPNGVATLSPYSNSIFFTTLPTSTTCPTPTGLLTSNITANSALLSWQPVMVNYFYNVRYRIANTINWTVVTGPNTTLPLSNLIPATLYEWQVQTICSNSTPNTITSPYSASVYFTTLSGTATCLTPTNLSESNITDTSATLHWNSTGSTSYHVRYRPSTSTTWTYKSSNTNSKTIIGLIAGTAYNWQVRSICAVPGSVSIKSPWSVTRTFTTLTQLNCPAPQNLTVGNIFANTAYAIWNSVPSAIGYQFSYRIVSPVNPNTSWIYINTSTTNVAMQNIMSGSVYECRVRSRCAATSTNAAYGPWSPSVIFTTPTFISVFPNPSTEQVTFTITSEEFNSAELQVFDFTGNAVRKLNSSVNIGENNLNLDVTPLDNGIYTYLYRQGTQTSRGKFIVKH